MLPPRAGTEDDTGADVMGVEVLGGGRTPFERKEGHRLRSSGSEVPVSELGEMCERMAAASRS